MEWPNTPDNRPVTRQISGMFGLIVPIIYDIDFSRWYESISMILCYDEYFGDDLPISGWAQLKFLNVHTFVFRQQKNEEHPFRREQLSLPMRGFTKELDKETGKRHYRLVL